ncbi:MAG: hypothetical protein JXR95_01180 [Deltaproteobacteria bacterium]|nr:hypothetical protein [Deltaproteobacteria bacterium]
MIRVSSRTVIVSFDFAPENEHMMQAYISNVLLQQYGASRKQKNVFSLELGKNTVDRILELIAYTETYISPDADTVNIWYHLDTDGKLRVYHTLIGARIKEENETDSIF